MSEQETVARTDVEFASAVQERAGQAPATELTEDEVVNRVAARVFGRVSALLEEHPIAALTKRVGYLESRVSALEARNTEADAAPSRTVGQ